MKRVPIAAVMIGAVLGLVLVVFWASYQVRFNETAVRIRFGKAESVIDKPGFGWKLPYPIETVKTFDKRLRVLDTPETELKTQDGQSLIVGLTALWRVDNPLTYSIRVPRDAEAQDAIRSRIIEARNSVIGRHNMSELFNLDAASVAATRDRIEQEIAAAASPGLLTDYGVKLEQVRIRRNTVPEEATGQIQQAMISERNTLATRFSEEGKSIAVRIKARADAARKQIMQFAERRAQEIESAGVKASARLLEQIQAEDSEFFIYLRQVEALEAALRSKGTIILDSRDALFRAFQMPYVPGSTKREAAPATGGSAAGAQQ